MSFVSPVEKNGQIVGVNLVDDQAFLKSIAPDVTDLANEIDTDDVSELLEGVMDYLDGHVKDHTPNGIGVEVLDPHNHVKSSRMEISSSGGEPDEDVDVFFDIQPGIGEAETPSGDPTVFLVCTVTKFKDTSPADPQRVESKSQRAVLTF